MIKELKGKKIKKFPPILFPLWLIAFMIYLLIELVKWLFGCWRCDVCKRQFTLFDTRHKDVIEVRKIIRGKSYMKFKKVHVCNTCKSELNKQRELIKDNNLYMKQRY